MPASVREQLINAIVTAVSGEWWLPTPEAEVDLPFCLVQDGEEIASADDYGHTSIELPIIVAKAASADSTDKTVLRQQCNELLAGIIQDMFTDPTYGGLVDGVDYTGGSIQTEVGRYCFAEAQFTIRYHTVRGDPYTIDLD